MEELRRFLASVSDFLNGCIALFEQLKQISFQIGTALVHLFLVLGGFIALGWLATVIYAALLKGHP